MAGRRVILLTESVTVRVVVVPLVVTVAVILVDYTETGSGTNDGYCSSCNRRRLDHAKGKLRRRLKISEPQSPMCIRKKTLKVRTVKDEDNSKVVYFHDTLA